MSDVQQPVRIESPRLAAPGLRHGFFTRIGGVSDGLYATLNAGPGSSDVPGHVVENRSRIAAALGAAPDHLVTPYQVHSADAVIVDAPFDGERPKADAIVTATPGLAVAVVRSRYSGIENRIFGL